MALATVAGFATLGLPSQAAVITLTGVNNNTCSYSSMSVQPDGSFNVICSGNVQQGGGGTTTTDAGVFTFSSSAGSGSVIGGDNPFPVVRTSGFTGAVTMTYTVSGAGCTNGVGTLNFADGQTSQNALVWGQPGGGSCTITLNSPSTSATVTTGPRLGTPSSIAVTIGSGGGSGTGTPPVDPTVCPTGYTQPAEMLTGDFRPVGNVLLQMQKSSQVVAL
jgi:hypothetical protein